MSAVRTVLGKLLDWVAPRCPRCGKRMLDRPVTNAYGNTYCWSRECIAANFDEVTCLDRSPPHE